MAERASPKCGLRYMAGLWGAQREEEGLSSSVPRETLNGCGSLESDQSKALERWEVMQVSQNAGKEDNWQISPSPLRLYHCDQRRRWWCRDHTVPHSAGPR